MTFLEKTLNSFHSLIILAKKIFDISQVVNTFLKGNAQSSKSFFWHVLRIARNLTHLTHLASRNQSMDCGTYNLIGLYLMARFALNRLRKHEKTPDHGVKKLDVTIVLLWKKNRLHQLSLIIFAVNEDIPMFVSHYSLSSTELVFIFDINLFWIISKIDVFDAVM